MEKQKSDARGHKKWKIIVSVKNESQMDLQWQQTSFMDKTCLWIVSKTRYFINVSLRFNMKAFILLDD